MKLVKVISILILFALASTADAKVSSAEAGKLGGELTPIGAEKAGNKDGTIPAWDGGIKSPPAGYKVGNFHVDPFGSDKVEFTITASNMSQYASKLTKGHMALLKKYPTYKMNVYKTRRSMSFPGWIYEASKKNATTGELTKNRNGVKNASMASPFPIPQSGEEVMFNHTLRFHGEDLSRIEGRAVPTQSGSYTFNLFEQSFYPIYARKGAKYEDIDNVAYKFIGSILEPPRLAGGKFLVHETIDQETEARKAWIYNPGQRRVRRAPNIAFDTPASNVDGLKFFDQVDMFNGSLEKFDWKLVGKKEMYIPYNAYKVHAGSLKVKDIVKPKHVNQDLLRYELHRVWVVESTLKKGSSHVFSRRTFYVDEDTWAVVSIDNYDSRGNLWRVSEGHLINYYEVPTPNYTLELVMDLQNGRYVADGLDNEKRPYDYQVEFSEAKYTPAAIRRSGKR